MTEEEKIIEQRIQPWRFWLFAALTAFLVVTVGLYLPLRFRHQNIEVAMPHGDEMMMREAADHHTAARFHEEGDVREGPVVNLNVSPAPILVSTTTRLEFFVNEKPGDLPIPVSELEIAHEKLMHVIGARSDLDEFFHIHPDPTGPAGYLSVRHVFEKPGRYKIWSEIRKDGANHTFGHPEIEVIGAGERSRKQISFARNVIVGDYQIAMRLGESVAAGREIELLFDVHTLDSFETELENYIGERMHLPIIKDDWKQFLHTHPAGERDHHAEFPLVPEVSANGGGHDTSEGGHGVIFSVTFPEAGLYKLFAQFRPAGTGLAPEQALTAAFWVRVEEVKFLGASAWWLYLFVSLIFIALLSIGAKKYLNPTHESR